MTKTTTQTDILNEVRRAIDAAPSRPALIAAEKKMAELGAARAETEAKITRLNRELRAGKDEPTSRAAELLEGKQLSNNPLSMDLGAARRQLATLAQAIAMHQRIVQNLRSQATVEVNLSLRPVRQIRVTQMSAALAELLAAVVEDATVRAEFQKFGLNAAEADVLAFAAVSGERDDYAELWRSARIAQGYTL
jgi:hypothetical protein